MGHNESPTFFVPYMTSPVTHTTHNPYPSVLHSKIAPLTQAHAPMAYLMHSLQISVRRCPAEVDQENLCSPSFTSRTSQELASVPVTGVRIYVTQVPQHVVKAVGPAAFLQPIINDVFNSTTACRITATETLSHKRKITHCKFVAVIDAQSYWHLAVLIHRLHGGILFGETGLYHIENRYQYHQLVHGLHHAVRCGPRLQRHELTGGYPSTPLGFELMMSSGDNYATDVILRQLLEDQGLQLLKE